MSVEQRNLNDLARIALHEARLELKRTGSIAAIIMARERTGRLRRMDIPEGMGWMLNDGRFKEILFGALRQVVKDQGFTAFITVMEAWLGVATEEGMKMAEANPDEYRRLGSLGVIEMEKRGLVRRSEVLTCVAQTPEGFSMINQEFWRGPDGDITFGPVEDLTGESLRSSFEGRLKMF